MTMTKADKELLKRMSFLRDLLKDLGANLSGYDPGVSDYLPDGLRGEGYWGESLSFDGNEWKWLEPLLVELRDRRKTAPEYIRFARVKRSR